MMELFFHFSIFLFSNFRNERNNDYYPQLKLTTYHHLDKLILAKDNLTAMHIAAFTDSLECFVILEESGLNINALSANNYLPFHYALVGGSLEVSSYIISKDHSQIFNEDTTAGILI